VLIDPARLLGIELLSTAVKSVTVSLDMGAPVAGLLSDS
jgi:hypothetical protein